MAATRHRPGAASVACARGLGCFRTARGEAVAAASERASGCASEARRRRSRHCTARGVKSAFFLHKAQYSCGRGTLGALLPYPSSCITLHGSDRSRFKSTCLPGRLEACVNNAQVGERDGNLVGEADAVGVLGETTDEEPHHGPAAIDDLVVLGPPEPEPCLVLSVKLLRDAAGRRGGSQHKAARGNVGSNAKCTSAAVRHTRLVDSAPGARKLALPVLLRAPLWPRRQRGTAAAPDARVATWLVPRATRRGRG